MNDSWPKILLMVLGISSESAHVCRQLHWNRFIELGILVETSLTVVLCTETFDTLGLIIAIAAF